MRKEHIKISWLDASGEKHPWLTIADYDDPKHPNRKYCYYERSPWVTWFDDAENLQDVLSYLWKNVIDAKAITEDGVTIIVEKA